jgi:hypothetical protein
MHTAFAYCVPDDVGSSMEDMEDERSPVSMRARARVCTWTLLVTQSCDQEQKCDSDATWGPFVYWTEAEARDGLCATLAGIMDERLDSGSCSAVDSIGDEFPGCFRLNEDKDGNIEYRLKRRHRRDAKLLVDIVEFTGNSQSINVRIEKHEMRPRMW